jgi:hypothetical protein
VTARLAAVLGRPAAGAAAPPGVEASPFALALLEDTYELVAGMPGVATVLAACPPSYAAQAARVAWPGTPVLAVTDGETDAVTRAALDLLAAHGTATGAHGTATGAHGTATGAHGVELSDTGERGRSGRHDSGEDPPEDGRGAGRRAAVGVVGVVVCGDAPDLPPLLVAKLFAALDTAEAAICPCEGGGLVAIGTRLPVPAWVASSGAGLDTPAATARLRAVAPRRALVVGPGWRRLRRPADVARLDAGLEGWDMTRALLSGHRG